MLYVHGIKSESLGELQAHNFALDSKICDCELILADTESSDVRHVWGSFVSINPLLGYWEDKHLKSGVAVVMSRQAVMLHEFVVMAETLYQTSPFQYHNQSVFSESDKYKYSDTVVSCIVVGYIEVHGSVVTWQQEYGRDIHNIYGLLVQLSKLYQENLFSYETIQLYNSQQTYRTTIRLSQSPEAKRFYTKVATLEGL